MHNKLVNFKYCKVLILLLSLTLISLTNVSKSISNILVSNQNTVTNENYDFVLKQKIVEALIFSSSEPILYNELLKRIIDKKILNEILENLEKKYFL